MVAKALHGGMRWDWQDPPVAHGWIFSSTLGEPQQALGAQGLQVSAAGFSSHCVLRWTSPAVSFQAVDEDPELFLHPKDLCNPHNSKALLQGRTLEQGQVLAARSQEEGKEKEN